MLACVLRRVFGCVLSPVRMVCPYPYISYYVFIVTLKNVKFGSSFLLFVFQFLVKIDTPNCLTSITTHLYHARSCQFLVSNVWKLIRFWHDYTAVHITSLVYSVPFNNSCICWEVLHQHRSTSDI